MFLFSCFMNILLLSRHIVLPLCLTIFIITLRDYFNENDHNYWWSVFLSALKFKQTSLSSNYQTSSVFCRGTNHTDRLCYFQHLCYEPVNDTYVFFRGPKSIQAGLPLDRFSPSLIDFSSVEDHNTLYFNYVEVPLSAASMFNFSIIEGHALMFKRFHPENLMHVFHDDLIPAFATLQELSLLSHEDSFLVFADDWKPGPYAELYRKFLPKEPLYLDSVSQKHLTCFKNVYVGLNKLPTWYHYGFKVPQGPLPKAYDKTAPVILEFRDYFLKQFQLDKISNDEEKHAILFSRKHNREIINEDEVLSTITKLTGLRTKVVSLDTTTVCEIVQTLASCQLVVGMHGSLLILSLFLDPGSILIELFPFGIHSCDITPYKTLCNASGLGLVYRAWENTIEANTRPHPEYPATLGGLMHLTPEEQKRVQKSTVTPFLCCDNPTWLYRVYQDTIVELSSFALVLQEAYIEHQRLITNSEQILVSSGIVPSDVLNISCVVLNESVTLAWDPPWNLGFMSVSFVEYEVWIQDVETDDMKAFVVKQRRLVLPVKSLQSALYYVWVRCYADGRVGPFGPSPFVISK